MNLDEIIDAIKKSEILIAIKKSSGAILFIFGMSAGLIRVSMEKHKKYTKGEIFLVSFTGGLSSYLFGGVAGIFFKDPQWLSLIGFFSGFLGFSILNYILENEKMIMHDSATKIGKLVDLFIDRITSVFGSKKQAKEDE